jgi:hypothetical protein
VTVAPATDAPRASVTRPLSEDDWRAAAVAAHASASTHAAASRATMPVTARPETAISLLMLHHTFQAKTRDAPAEGRKKDFGFRISDFGLTRFQSLQLGFECSTCDTQPIQNPKSKIQNLP